VRQQVFLLPEVLFLEQFNANAPPETQGLNVCDDTDHIY
jgi:hypothetical protein